MAGVLVPLATFAGGITLATRFIITCPGSRLEALLALASQLFLATPLVLLAVYLLLYGRADTDAIARNKAEHLLVVGQFIVAATALGAAFVIVGVAIFVAQVGDYKIGIGGLVLLGLVVAMALLSGCMGPSFRGKIPTEADPRSRAVFRANPIRYFHVGMVLVQLLAIITLLILGGYSSSKACVQHGCTANATTDPVERTKASDCLSSKSIANPSRT